MRQWVVGFPKRVRYFLNFAAGCQNRVTGIAMREVQRATSSSMHRLLHPAGAEGEPILELEFDQT